MPQLPGNSLADTACLAARQPDPKQPGRTDAIVNGMAQIHSESGACPVCNATMPCLYDVRRKHPPTPQSDEPSRVL